MTKDITKRDTKTALDCLISKPIIKKNVNSIKKAFFHFQIWQYLHILLGIGKSIKAQVFQREAKNKSFLRDEKNQRFK